MLTTCKHSALKAPPVLLPWFWGEEKGSWKEESESWWWFHPDMKLNSTTTVFSVYLFKERGGENMEKGSRVTISMGRSLTNYCHWKTDSIYGD